MSQPEERFGVVWSEGGDPTRLTTLVHKDTGRVRTFTRDDIDPRLGEVAVVTTEWVMLDRLAPGKRVAVPVSVLRSLGLTQSKGWVFDIDTDQ